MARQIERASSGLAYGLWAGLLGAVALGTAYVVLAGYVSILLGVGVLVVPAIATWLDRLAALFADRASYAVGHRLLAPAPISRDGAVTSRFARTVADPRTYRSVIWALVMGVTGVVIGSAILLAVFAFARELTVPLWWWAVPPGEANTALGLPIDTWAQAISTTATAPVYLAATLWVLPALARAQARLGASVLGCSTVGAGEAANQEPPAAAGTGRGVVSRRVDRLTPRENEVLGLIARGMDNTAIAEELVVSQAAVLKHVRSIFVKLDLPPGERGHRRVLAVLAYLAHPPERGSAGATISET